MVDLKKEEQVKSTDMAPVTVSEKGPGITITLEPIKYPPPTRQKVKIQLPRGRETQARITSKDGSIDMMVTAAMVAKRFPRGATIAYFRSDIKSQVGSLEIGERIPDEDW